MSHSCQTDICSTVRRFSRLLLHNNVMSCRKSFFTSISDSVCLDWRISVATTLSITAMEQKGWEGSNERVNRLSNEAKERPNQGLTMNLALLTWILKAIMTLGLRMTSVEYLLRYVLGHYLVQYIVCGQGERLLVQQQTLCQKSVQIVWRHNVVFAPIRRGLGITKRRRKRRAKVNE